MDMPNKFSLGVALCALLCFSLPAGADEIQDANKLFKQGQNAQALDKVNGVLAAKPKDAQARFLKALILNDQGDTAGAIKIFTALTEDYPELPEPYNNLAVLYAGQGQYEKAKDALEMAIRTHPSYATAHENLGDIYAKMASQAYDRALQLDKSNTATQTKLALIRDLFGKSAQGGKPAIVAATKPAAAVAVPAAPQPVAVAVAQPAATPVPAKVEPVAAANDYADVLKATRDWAAAWSAKDSDKYLSFYADEFNPPAGTSRGVWEEQRRERITTPKSISVEIREAGVKVLDAQHASISFRQIYRASHLNADTKKTLLWVKVGGQWQIAEERSGK